MGGRVRLRGGGQGRCERRSEVFVKIQKELFFFGGWCQVGGGGGRVGGQGGCERRIEVFVIFFLIFFWGVGLGGVRVDVNGEVKFL